MRARDRVWRAKYKRIRTPAPNSYTPGELYDQVVARGLKHDHHASDLYIEVTPAARQLIACYKNHRQVTTFVSQIDGRQWYDVPLAYAPFWRGKA